MGGSTAAGGDSEEDPIDAPALGAEADPGLFPRGAV